MNEVIIGNVGLMILIKRNDSGHYHIKTGKAGEHLTDWKRVKVSELCFIAGITSKQLRRYFL